MAAVPEVATNVLEDVLFQVYVEAPVGTKLDVENAQILAEAGLMVITGNVFVFTVIEFVVLQPALLIPVTV